MTEASSSTKKGTVEVEVNKNKRHRKDKRESRSDSADDSLGHG
jgi:hypothetical protein